MKNSHCMLYMEIITVGRFMKCRMLNLVVNAVTTGLGRVKVMVASVQFLNLFFNIPGRPRPHDICNDPCSKAVYNKSDS